MEVPPGLDFEDSLEIINLLQQVPNTEDRLKLMKFLFSMYIKQANEKHGTNRSNTVRKRLSNQMDNERKKTKESAKKTKREQLNKTENSKDTSKVLECLLIFEERKCYICGKIFDETSTFVNHLREYDNLCCMVEEGQLKNVIQCALCEKSYHSNGPAKRHVNASHKAIKEICDSDAFTPKYQTPIDTNNPPPIAESSNATAVQPTGQTLITNNQNGEILDNRQTPQFCLGCGMPVPDYRVYMASYYNKNLGGESERSINTHMTAHMNNQGNVKEEKIERNVQDSKKGTSFLSKNHRINPLSHNSMEKEFIKRSNAQRNNVSHNVRSMNETAVVPENNSQPSTSSERGITKGAEEDSFATNSYNSKVNTGSNNDVYNDTLIVLKEFFGKETKTLVKNAVIDLTSSDDEDAISQLNNTPSSSAYRQRISEEELRSLAAMFAIRK